MSITTAPGATSIGRALGAAAKTTGAAAVVAVVANVAVYAIGRGLGADFAAAPSGRQGLTIGAGLVLLTTVVPLVPAGVALAVASRWGAKGWRVVAWVGLAIGVLSVVMPLTIEATAGTKSALVLMHVLTGVTWFVVVRRSVGSRAADR